jgi:predicted PurR-regulated permease PerM
MEKKQRVTIDLSWMVFVKVIVALALFWVAFMLREMLLLLFVTFIFVAAATPAVKRFERRMSRHFAVGLLFAIILLAVTAVGLIFVPILAEQVNTLVIKLPAFLDRVRPFVETYGVQLDADTLNQALSGTAQGLQGVGGNIFAALATLFGGVIAVLTVLVLSFYLLIEENSARIFLSQVLPADRYKTVYAVAKKISIQLGAWVRGQFIIVLAVMLLNSAVYAALGMPGWLPLGVWAGITELIPYVGPLIGVLPGIAVAIATGNIVTVVLVVVLNYIVIQQIQNFVITPRVMGKAVGLSPVLVILSISAGLSLFGVIGALIALPSAAIIAVLVEEWPRITTLWERKGEE